MHAYLLIGNKNKEEEVSKLARSLGALVLNYPAERIEDVRKLIRFVKLKNVKPQVILIDNFEQATHQAQNALLKNLEEPQQNLYYIVCASSLNPILPTIQSRCQIIKLGFDDTIDSDINVDLFFSEKDVGTIFLEIAKVTAREDAIKLLSNIIVHGHAKLTKGKIDHLRYGLIITLAQSTLRNIKNYGNVKINLGNFAIGLV